MQRADDAEELFLLGERQHRGRLVEDEDAGLGGERPRQLDQLAVGDAERGDELVRVEMDVVALQQVARGLAGAAAIDEARAAA